MNQEWERLKRLLSLGEAAMSQGPQLHSPQGRPGAPALKAASLQVLEEATPFGSFLMRELEFPRSHVHGNTPLEWLLTSGGEGRALLGKDHRLREIEPSSLLFLDLETTGLGGAGAYAFLVGLGFFRGDRFYIRQYFMRDFSEERALLCALRDFLGETQGVVSYNGKVFDLPFLSGRFILNRMRSPLEDLPHLDLLFPARRLWRERIGSCSLISLEENLLGIRRVEDVPSELIPSVYFRYLQYKNPSIIQPVFDHNVHDLLSLMALKARACSMIEDPQGCALRHGEDYYCLGRLFEDLGQWERSISCYQFVLEGKTQVVLREEAQRRLSLIHKRLGDRRQAVAIWQGAMGDGARFDPFPYEELAKHREHLEKDYEGALEIVNRALEGLGTKDLAQGFMEWQERFLHRQHRLQCKLRGKRWY